MKVTRTDNSATNVTMLIKGDATDLAPIKRHVLTHFTDQVKVPGFRAGKAPAELVEKHVNQQRFLDEFMEHALNDLFVKAVEDNNIKPIGLPDVKLKKFVPYTELEFEATIDALGQVKLADYKNIKLAKPKVEATAKDVNDVIESLKNRLAERIDVDRPAKDGDEVNINFEGKDENGDAVAGADGKDYPLILGSKSFIPGFEENIVGMKAGETKEFKVTFPKDYSVAALQSKKVTFKVTANNVQELLEPKLDDEFAKKAGGAGTLKDLKDDIKKQVKSEKEFQAEQSYQNQLVQTITDKSKLEVPKTLVDDQIARMEEQEKQNLLYRGISWQEHLDQEGITEEQHRERQRPDAESRVKGGLVLSEIAKEEGLDVSAEEVEMRMQILRGQYQDPQMLAELDKPDNRRDIESRILTEKTLQKLVGYASK
jgi:trigger factor